MPDVKQHEPPSASKVNPVVTGFLISSVAALLLMKKGQYSTALRFYPKTGGGGFNIYQTMENGKNRRCFALDYHPFWDQQLQRKEWKLHYHRGATQKECRLHRPYQGGW